jgi:hypothetical protein
MLFITDSDKRSWGAHILFALLAFGPAAFLTIHLAHPVGERRPTSARALLLDALALIGSFSILTLWITAYCLAAFYDTGPARRLTAAAQPSATYLPPECAAAKDARDCADILSKARKNPFDAFNDWVPVYTASEQQTPAAAQTAIQPITIDADTSAKVPLSQKTDDQITQQDILSAEQFAREKGVPEEIIKDIGIASATTHLSKTGQLAMLRVAIDKVDPNNDAAATDEPPAQCNSPIAHDTLDDMIHDKGEELIDFKDVKEIVYDPANKVRYCQATLIVTSGIMPVVFRFFPKSDGTSYITNLRAMIPSAWGAINPWILDGEIPEIQARLNPSPPASVPTRNSSLPPIHCDEHGCDR